MHSPREPCSGAGAAAPLPAEEARGRLRFGAPGQAPEVPFLPDAFSAAFLNSPRS